METVGRREWVIQQVHDDVVVLEQQPDGRTIRVPRNLLPGDLASGDRFRVVAQVDRRRTDRPGPELFDLRAALGSNS